MLTNAPWLNVNPLDFVGAAAKGADLGLRASQIATGANEAADRLRLSYAQLAAEQSMHAATTGASEHRASAELALHAALAKQANDARLARIGIAGQHQSMLEENAADRLRQLGAERLLHVGQGVYGYDPKTGSFKTKLEPPKAVDPFTRMKYQSALGRAKSARSALNRPGLDDDTKAAIQKDLQEANAEIQAIESGVGGAGKTLSLDATLEAPLGWQSTTGGASGGWQRPVLPPAADEEMADDEGAGGGPAAGTFKVGKYAVTPLK